MLEIDCDELARVAQFVSVRTAVTERIVAAPRPQRLLLPTGKVEQAWVTRQLPLRRTVVCMREFVDHCGQCGTFPRVVKSVRCGLRHPAVEEMAVEQQLVRSSPPDDVFGQIVTPVHSQVGI